MNEYDDIITTAQLIKYYAMADYEVQTLELIKILRKQLDKIDKHEPICHCKKKLKTDGDFYYSHTDELQEIEFNKARLLNI